MLMIALTVKGIDLFKKGHVVITAEQNSTSTKKTVGAELPTERK
jgi:hypothetical protein